MKICVLFYVQQSNAHAIKGKGNKMEIKIKQQQRPTYNRNLVDEDYITARMADAVEKRFKCGTIPSEQGFVSLWYRADKNTSKIAANGALMFTERTITESDLEVNKKIFNSKGNSLYVYAVGAYFIIEDTKDHYIVKTVLLNAEGYETF